ncbi:MAG: hypothetical protein KAT16_01405 [Candidatus Heimdallarchaeota archaeon]|nr:hypothetical protein [Candidatus Heimdallarchaeota archaeon]
MDSAEKEILLLLTQFARRPGVRLYHYSTLSTLDDKGRPYNRLRSPAVIRPYEILIDEINKQISGDLPTRYTKERLEEVRAADTKYKDTIEKHAWQFVFLEETADKNHIKKSVPHLKKNPYAHLVCMEALVVMTPQGPPTIQRGTKDLVFDLELDTIENRGQPMYDHRTARYMLMLADSHLASYDDKEARYYDTVFDIWTGKHTSITHITQKEKGPLEILSDLPFTNKKEGLQFLKKHNRGTIAIKNPDTNRAFSTPTSFVVDEEVADGFFWLIDDEQDFMQDMYTKIVKNLSQGDSSVSVCCPAFGMRHELGIAIEGDVNSEGAEIDDYKAKTGYHGSMVYVTPRRITNISTPADRRGKIVFSEWD